MNTITHFVFLKYIIENDLKKIKKTNYLNNTSKNDSKLKRNNNSVDNFFKFQWSWTL